MGSLQAAPEIPKRKIDNRLFAPEQYRAASPEVIAQVVNGCGTAGWKGKLVPDTIWFLNVKEACQIHDWMYAVGQTAADKEEADEVFLINLNRLVNEATGFWADLLRNHRRLRVREYYLAVRYCGGPAFWTGKNPEKNLVQAEMEAA